MLPGVVDSVAIALRLPYAAIEVEQAGRLERVAAHGEPGGPAVALPLSHGGVRLGQLVLGLRPGDDAFSPADSRVLADLAEHAGQAVHAVRLTADLQRARERIVAAREEERRTLRRDLHDGIGPTLAGITLQVDVARSLLGTDVAAARGMVEKLRGETQAAVKDVRRVVEALRPPDLDELGLAGAIRRLEIECETSGDLDRLPAAVEVAAYRIVQEARGIQRVRIERNGALEIEMTGRAEEVARLAAMRERAGELGGTCVLEARPGGEFSRARAPAIARGAGMSSRGAARPAWSFRGYEVDALLRRSLVYVTVTTLLLGAYVGLLLVIGPLPGTSRGFAVSVVAAIPVALLFGPLRRRLQRAVNRLLYGEDDDPHAAVRELASSLAASLSPAAALPTVVETVTRTLRVPYAAILLEQDGVLEPAAETGAAPAERLSLPLAYAGARLGVLEIGLAEGGELSAADRLLLGGLARQAGVAAHAVQIASDLQRSRERARDGARGGAPPAAPRPARRARPDAGGDGPAAARSPTI